MAARRVVEVSVDRWLDDSPAIAIALSVEDGKYEAVLMLTVEEAGKVWRELGEVIA